MSLRYASSIEMAPDHYWNTYQATGGQIAFRPDSDLLDVMPSLVDVLDGERLLSSVTGTSEVGGNEARIHRVNEGGEVYGFKVPDIKDNNVMVWERVLQMGRYGGVCIEQALGGVTIDGIPLGTPRYEAILSTGSTGAVVMSWEEGEELYSLATGTNFGWDTTVQLKKKIIKKVKDQLMDIGIDTDGGWAGRFIDVHNARNILLQTSDTDVRDITAITILDAFDTREWYSRDKLWQPKEEAV